MHMGLGGFRELVMGREAWCVAVHGVSKGRIRLSDRTELNQYSSKIRKGRIIRKQLKIIYAFKNISSSRGCTKWLPDSWDLNALPQLPPPCPRSFRPLCLLAGELRSWASPWARSPLGYQAALAGREGSWARPAGTWVMGAAHLQLASDSMVSASLDFRKRSRAPRPLTLWTWLACAPLRNLGYKSQCAWWDGGWGGIPVGPDADTLLGT